MRRVEVGPYPPLGRVGPTGVATLDGVPRPLVVVALAGGHVVPPPRRPKVGGRLTSGLLPHGGGPGTPARLPATGKDTSRVGRPPRRRPDTPRPPLLRPDAAGAGGRRPQVVVRPVTVVHKPGAACVVPVLDRPTHVSKVALVASPGAVGRPPRPFAVLVQNVPVVEPRPVAVAGTRPPKVILA